MLTNMWNKGLKARFHHRTGFDFVWSLSLLTIKVCGVWQITFGDRVVLSISGEKQICFIKIRGIILFMNLFHHLTFETF